MVSAHCKSKRVQKVKVTYRMLRIVPLGDSHTRVVLSVSSSGGEHIMLTLLQLELLNTGLIGSDGGALDTDTILLDGLSGLGGDLVIGLVTVLKTLKQGQCTEIVDKYSRHTRS